MDREDFFAWLETCPTHKWELIQDDGGHVWVAFSHIWEYDDDPEQDAA